MCLQCDVLLDKSRHSDSVINSLIGSLGLLK